VLAFDLDAYRLGPRRALVELHVSGGDESRRCACQRRLDHHRKDVVGPGRERDDRRVAPPSSRPAIWRGGSIR
ncbi:MAG: hypothetical protein ACE1Z6_06490, partial [Candidatus Methylomirabilales bacterium]